MHVIQEWGVQLFTHLVVSSADDDEGLTDRQEHELMTNTAAWWDALHLDLLPLHGHDFGF